MRRGCGGSLAQPGKGQSLSSNTTHNLGEFAKAAVNSSSVFPGSLPLRAQHRRHTGCTRDGRVCGTLVHAGNACSGVASPVRGAARSRARVPLLTPRDAAPASADRLLDAPRAPDCILQPLRHQRAPGRSTVCAQSSSARWPQKYTRFSAKQDDSSPD